VKKFLTILDCSCRASLE